MQQSTIAFDDIPCSITEFSSSFHYSDEWANSLLKIWIETRRAFVKERWEPLQFHRQLKHSILDHLDIEGAFEEGCAQVGLDADDAHALYDAYYDRAFDEVMSLIPSNLYGELCWVPGWTTEDLDDLMYKFGVQSQAARSTYLESVIPGQWLKTFLELVNCSSVDLIGYAVKNRDTEGKGFAEHCAAQSFYVAKSQDRHQVMTPEQVVATIENAYWQAVPMAHAEINIRALFSLDPTQPMVWSSDKRGEVHVGFHEFFNGAGYMDTYKGEIAIAPDEVGFATSDRWGYGINKVYDLYRPAFYTTPHN